MKYVCNACGYQIKDKEATLLPRAIDPDIPIVVCSSCGVHDQCRWACANPGCWNSPVAARSDGNWCQDHK